MTPPTNDDGSDDEWKFSVEDVSDGETGDGAAGDGAAGDQAGEQSERGSIFGPRPDEGRIEVVAGDPDLENVLFVVLGGAASILLLLDLIGLV